MQDIAAATRNPTVGHLAGGGALVVLLGLGVGYDAPAVAVSAACYAFLVALLLTGPDRPPTARFGIANQATLARAILVCAIGGVVALGPTGAAQAWAVAAVALAAAALDGVDGWLARRYGASAFGARFDMETDALFVLILALVVWQFGKTGPWVLAAGAMRYAFGAAGLLWPVLRRPLPASRRRQAICAIQTLALVVCLAPAVAPGVAGPIAGVALAALAGSFLTDILRLLSAARPEVQHEA